jgi:pyruvate dehydrogenase (quinone)
VAKAVGLWGRKVSKAGDLEEAVRACLPQPGPALLHEGEPDAAGDASSPLIAPEAVVGMAVYSASAMLQGIGRDVWEMMVENIP